MTRLIQCDALGNGAHNNMTITDEITEIPDGWAVIPNDMEIPDTFPFVNIMCKNGKVVKMTAGTPPKSVSAIPQPSDYDRLEAQVLFTAVLTDTLLEESDFYV